MRACVRVCVCWWGSLSGPAPPALTQRLPIRWLPAPSPVCLGRGSLIVSQGSMEGVTPLWPEEAQLPPWALAISPRFDLRWSPLLENERKRTDTVCSSDIFQYNL